MNDPRAENDSPSEVLRATHLVAVVLSECRLGEWTQTPDSPLLTRFVELTVVLDQILKGHVEQLCGESTTLCVQQRGTGSRRVSDDYGVWSKVELQPGQRLVAFCTSPARDLAELLQPPHCTQLAGVEVLRDLRTCMDLEGRQWPAAELVSRVSPLLSWRSGILARYLWARSGPTALADASVFELFMQLLERPNTSAEARDVLMTAAYETLAMTETPARAQVLRFARAMLVMLTVPEAQAMHENLMRVYLPNFIGLARGHVELAASEVFADHPPARALVERALTARGALDPEGALLRWLLEGRTP